MNLRTLSMLPDDIGPLGPPIRREQTKPAPAPTVQQREDGTLTTNPDGSMSFEARKTWTPADAGMVKRDGTQPVPVWPLPHAQKPAEPEEPGAHGFMREPLKVGDRVRLKTGWIAPLEGAVVSVTAIFDGLNKSWASEHCGVWDYMDSEGIYWERVQ